MARSIILFELNEVPHRVLDQYCRRHPDGEFARRLARSFRYETVTEDVGHLSPWLTWPTLHRGVNNQRHLISDFGQNTKEADSEYPPLWHLLATAGVSTGIGGSLHTYPVPHDLTNYSFYLPDTFAAGPECFPKVLETFQAFNLAMARESARNVSKKIAWGDALRLLRRAPSLGFRPQTLVKVGRQLLDERLTPERRVRRRTYQAVLAFDVFMAQLRKTRPAFCTFFTNHVASSMHRYWAAAFPSDYAEMTYSEAWISTYRNEIDFAMGEAAEQLVRVFRFVDEHPSYVVWIASSMGQAATVARPIETQLYVVSPIKLMAALGFAREEWSKRPAMVPQFNVAVTPERQVELVGRLKELRIAALPLAFRQSEEGFVSMDFGHENLPDTACAQLAGRTLPFAELGLENVLIQDRSGTSAYHVPEGSLVVYDPLDARVRQRSVQQLSTLEMAPTILSNYGVAVRSYMRRPVKQLLNLSSET